VGANEARPRAQRARTVALRLVLVAATVTACGSGAKPPDPIDDAAAVATPVAVPDWFPSEWKPPPGAVAVEVISEPEPDFGRTVTWRSSAGYDEVVDQVGNGLAGLRWTPTEVTEDTDTFGTKRTSFFVENGSLYAIRVFEEAALDGVRITAELPSG